MDNKVVDSSSERELTRDERKRIVERALYPCSQGIPCGMMHGCPTWIRFCTEDSRSYKPESSDPSLTCSFLNDTHSYSPVHLAAKQGNAKALAKLLKENSGHVNLRDVWGNTPLILAAISRQQRVAKLLIARGANVMIRNNAGRVALHEAARNGDEKMILAICSAKLRGQYVEVNVYARHELSFYSPLDLALVLGHTTTVERLLSLGASADLGLKSAKVREQHGFDIPYWAWRESSYYEAARWNRLGLLCLMLAHDPPPCSGERDLLGEIMNIVHACYPGREDEYHRAVSGILEQNRQPSVTSFPRLEESVTSDAMVAA